MRVQQPTRAQCTLSDVSATQISAKEGGFNEAGRSRYVTDEEFEAVKAHADFTVADAMDLALLTGQRPADI
jgi:hypothetical protein